jgi:hypothetical protein
MDSTGRLTGGVSRASYRWRHPIARVESVSPTLPVFRGLAVPTRLSLLLAALLATSSTAGLLFGQRGLYDPDPATMPAFLAQDVISLLAGLPLLLGSLWLARRGSLRGLLV